MPISPGMQTSLPGQSYDHRIREAMCESRDPDLFPELDIPNSTIRSWLHRGVSDVNTSELVYFDSLARTRCAENRKSLRVTLDLVRARSSKGRDASLLE